ncbi:hypothetical protein MSG28_010624 [Choristoneura fumiferana]|uniref:Uncharacterized protein n=1 Tax=Choristoneura fumiferana TaxID=7141 RepID=A0ACC0KNW5_CHOFU|nr:hypothetical protein MSG28_010624 [Choristoneura fumiferana]
MDTEHDTDIMTKEALDFGEWLSRVAVPALLRRRTRLSERRARATTLRDKMDPKRLIGYALILASVQSINLGRKDVSDIFASSAVADINAEE